MQRNHFEPWYILMVHDYQRLIRISPEIWSLYPWYYHNADPKVTSYFLSDWVIIILPIEIIGLDCWVRHVTQLFYGDLKW